jgi:two-component system NtrC family sensor kinase
MSALGTILVVDDERGIRDMLVQELGRKGYRIETADNGRRALERLQAGGIDAVVSDLKMPELDGQQLLGAIKRIDPDLQVILVTGFATVEIAVAAMRLGAYAVLQKPFDVDELVLLLEKALEKRELKEIAAVYEASREFFRAGRLDDLLPRVAAQLSRTCRADSAAIALVENGRLTVAAAAGDAPCKGWGDKFECKDGECSHCADGAGAVLTPLTVGGTRLGVLCCIRADPADPFDAADLRLMTIFATQIALAVQNAQTFASLAQTQDRLAQSEKMGAVGRLAAGIAHEINNPLTSILGLAHILADQKSLSAEQSADVRTIIEQSERCRAITQDLLLFGRKREKKEPLIVEHLLKSAVRLSRLDIVSRRMSVTVREPEAAHGVFADAGKLQQVFLNLIGNAASATEGRDERRLEIRVESRGEQLDIRFSDNGCGIAAEALGRVFEPFFTTKGAGKGTGLGLAICRDIVSEHGGTITVTSGRGAGTEFTIALPALTRMPSGPAALASR